MKPKHKAIVKYVFYWVMMIGFGLTAWYANDKAFNSLLFNAEISFHYGTVFGIALFMSYFLLLEGLIPIGRYIKSKIRKNPVSFVDILVNR